MSCSAPWLICGELILSKFARLILKIRLKRVKYQVAPPDIYVVKYKLGQRTCRELVPNIRVSYY